MVTSQAQLPDLNDTIVALCSPAGSAARGIVRMSGRRAVAITNELCPEFDREHLTPGHFFRTQIRLPGFHPPISADIYFFSSPRTYTGQDVVEIHTLSCPPILEVLIAECLRAGARGAQAGEFTMRAFLAGKLDLTRAEAVLGVIEATGRDELKHALKQLAGGLAQPLSELREDLLNLLADIEAGLDFAEEDIHFVSTEVLLKRLAKGLAYLTLLSKQLDQRGMGQRAFRVVLCGPPNAGKSTLFNALVGKEAAIVSEEAGTTRDYLETRIALGDVQIDLVDTAGLRETTDTIDAAAQRLGSEQSSQADLLLWCHPCGEAVAPHNSVFSVERWNIATKADLGRIPPNYHATSATTGQGISELLERLAEHVRHSWHAAMAPGLSRCRHHIEACLQQLRHAYTIVLNGEMPELLALELRLALEEMGAMVGAVYTDDLLDRIFSRFCIGK